MQPPTELTNKLSAYDQGLRVRWSESLGRFSIERKHGFAGHAPHLVVELLHAKWKRLEVESDLDPANVELENDERLAYDQFIARRAGNQPIFYIYPGDAYKPSVVLRQLISMDIRAAGGPVAFMRRMKQRNDFAKAQRQIARKAEIRDKVEEHADRARTKKDFYGSGGDFYTYAHARRA